MVQTIYFCCNAVDSICGYFLIQQADLSQQGDLLLQDSFQVISDSKKDLRLRLKPQQRHVFLYQKAMLFCKQDTKSGHNKSTYQFKHWLKVSPRVLFLIEIK